MKLKFKTNKLVSLAAILIFLIALLSLIRNQTLSNDITFTSSIYKINDNTITNISTYTNIDLYKEYFDLENCTLKVVDNNNEEITTKYIYTGSKTLVYDNNNNLLYSYTNIIYGDITSDGISNDKDLQKLAKHLIENNILTEPEIKAINLNKDTQIKINDLTYLESYQNKTYESLTLNIDNITLMPTETTRLIATLNPNIVLNQNLIWTSSNESVAKVTNTGLVTAQKEGEAIITATTHDKTKMITAKIIVDNTIRLENNTLTLYRGGSNGKIGINIPNYNGLTCSSDNENIATCTIENNYVTISPKDNGETKINLTSPIYDETTIDVTVLFTSFSVFPKAFCLNPNQGAGGGIISGFNFGELSVKSISNREIIVFAHITRKGINITAGTKTGDAEVIFTESNGNNTSRFVGYVYKLYLAETSGTTTKEHPITTKIINDNAGELTCTSSNEEISSCSVEDDNLIITPITTGTSTITIKGSKCGEANYVVTVSEEVTE